VRAAIASVVGIVTGALVVPSIARAATPLGPRVGVSAGSRVLWEPDNQRRADLDFIAATGAKWFTLDIDWASIQPQRNTWNWGPTDRVVRDAKARGLQIIGTLAYSPRWAQPASCPAGTTHCFPANPVDYAFFAAAAASRYGNNSTVPGLKGAIGTWQIWNEANHYPFVRPTVDVVKYVEMLKIAYYFIKLNDFWTTVLAGGTSPAPDDPNRLEMAPVTFLASIYYLGGGKSFDAFSHHPYSFPCSPLLEAPWNAFYQTSSLYLTMAQHGDGTKKVWGTESGAPTGADIGSCTPNSPGVSVTEMTQAWYVHEYLWGWTVKYGAFTGPLIWHQIRNNGTNAMYPDDNFGLLRRDYSAKPSYQVFSSMMRGY
jgi:hypothetical protein